MKNLLFALFLFPCIAFAQEKPALSLKVDIKAQGDTLVITNPLKVSAIQIGDKFYKLNIELEEIRDTYRPLLGTIEINKKGNYTTLENFR